MLFVSPFTRCIALFPQVLLLVVPFRQCLFHLWQVYRVISAGSPPSGTFPSMSCHLCQVYRVISAGSTPGDTLPSISKKKHDWGVLRGAHRSSLEEATKWERERSMGSPPISGAQSDTSLQLRRNHAGSTKQDKLVRYREGALMNHAVV